MKNETEVTLFDVMETTNELKQTTNQILECLVDMKVQIHTLDQKFETKINTLDQKIETKLNALDQKFETKFNALDQKFEKKFDLLFDAVGETNEKFTVMDYKFNQLKHQVLTP